MKRLAALALLLALTACNRQEPPPSPAPAPPAAETPAAPEPAPAAAPAANAGNETEQAARSQESVGAEPERSPGDSSLEHMQPAPAAAPSGKWQPGTNYTVLVPAQPTSVAAGKVEVLEVFWLGCPHCYALEPLLATWRQSKPAYIEFVRVPVIWQPAHRSHARLYYTLEALGRDDLVSKAFDALVQQRQELYTGDEQESFRRQQKFATDNGVKADDFAKAYNSFTVNSRLQRAEELTQRYRVESVPFIIINGKYTTDVGKAGGESQLIDLINDLSAAEHGH